MKNLFLTLFAVAALLVRANETEIGTVVIAGSDNSLVPSNAVATIRELASAVAEAEANKAEAAIIRADQQYLDERMDYLQDEYDKREGTVYIKGFVRMFEGAVAVDTNATAQIMKFSRVTNFSGAQDGFVYYKFNTWFSVDIVEPPNLKYVRALGRTNSWETIETVYGAWEDVEQIEDDEIVIYQTYAQIVEMPASYASAFFRVFADLLGSGEAVMFSVNNGVSVNNRPGLTKTFGEGADALCVIGGICVQNETEAAAASVVDDTEE